MKKLCPVTLLVSLILLVSCSREHSAGPVATPSDETGALRLAITMDKIGALRKMLKAESIEMSNLYITLQADGQPAINDVISLTGGGHERSVSQTYTGLASWTEGRTFNWYLRVEARDQRGQVIYYADTSFGVPPLDTVDIAMFLHAQYSMLFANFSPIRDSVTRCQLKIDGEYCYSYADVDTTFPSQSLVGDTVTLSYDYLSASPMGNSHRIDLNVYGVIEGIDTLMYSGDTTIVVRSGEDKSYQVLLRSTGSSIVTGAATMMVTLGSVGRVTVNGNLITDDSGFSVTYNGNGNTGGTVPETRYYATGDIVAVTGNTGNLERAGFTFAGWSAVVRGVVTNFEPGDSFVMGKLGTYKAVLNANWVFTDVDGNVYHTVTIGTQTWMMENLKATHFNDNTAIPLIEDPDIWSNRTSPAFCWYNNDSTANSALYGALYNWYTVRTGKLAPAGWHVATDADWDTLESFLGGEYEAGGKLKEAGTVHWLGYSSGATNESGFTALPGGIRAYYSFESIGYTGMWWSATEYEVSYAGYRNLNSYSNSVSSGNFAKNYGCSVRCVMN